MQLPTNAKLFIDDVDVLKLEEKRTEELMKEVKTMDNKSEYYCVNPIYDYRSGSKVLVANTGDKLYRANGAMYNDKDDVHVCSVMSMLFKENVIELN